MIPVSSRTQWKLVAFGYAAVLVIAGVLLFGRHLVEVADPVSASGGMAAAGDTFLYLFIGFLFLIPTTFLIWIMAKSETGYTGYSRFLFGLSLSAPVCLVGFLVSDKYMPQSLGWLCLFRIIGSPAIFVGMGLSRFMARFDRARKLTSYALLIEGLTMGAALAVFLHG